MSLILAIEPDPDQAAAVRRAVRGVGSADLVLVDTREAALAALADAVPEVVLVSALLKPNDEAALTARLRARRDAAHVEMITIPLLEAEPGKSEKRGGLLGLFKKKQTRDDRQGRVSPRLFANEIKKHLERVRESHPEETREGEVERGPAELPDSVERLTLPPELTDAETSLSNRMARLKEFNHPGIQRTRGLEHDAAAGQLVLVCDRVPGLRASEMLTRASNCSLVADLPAPLFVMRRLLSTLGSLHAVTGVAQVGVAPQRIVITPRADVVVVEATLAGAHAGAGDDSRADIAQIALLGLSMVLGRTVSGNEDAEARSHLLAEVADVAAIRVSDDFAALLRSWFASALATEDDESFTGFDDAAMALERVEASGCVGSRLALKAFAKDLAFETFHAPAAAAIEAQRIRSTRARQIEKRNTTPAVPRRARWRAADPEPAAAAELAAPAAVPTVSPEAEEAWAHIELEPAATIAAHESIITPEPEPTETIAPVAAAAEVFVDEMLRTAISVSHATVAPASLEADLTEETVWPLTSEPVQEIELTAEVEAIATIVPDAWTVAEETVPVADEIAGPTAAVEEIAAMAETEEQIAEIEMVSAVEDIAPPPEEIAAPVEVEPLTRITSLFDRFRAVAIPEALPTPEPAEDLAPEIAAAVEEIEFETVVADPQEEVAEVEVVAPAGEDAAPPLEEIAAPVEAEPLARITSLFDRFRAVAIPKALPTPEATGDIAPEIAAAVEEIEFDTFVADPQEEVAEVEAVAAGADAAPLLDEVAAPVDEEPPSRMASLFGRFRAYAAPAALPTPEPTEDIAPEIAAAFEEAVPVHDDTPEPIAAVEEIAALAAVREITTIAEAEVVAAVEETAPPPDEFAAPVEAEPPPSRVVSLFGRFRAVAAPEAPSTPEPTEAIRPEIAAAVEELAAIMAGTQKQVAEVAVVAAVEETAPPIDEIAAPIEAEPLSRVMSPFDRLRAIAVPKSLMVPEPTAEIAPEIGAAVDETAEASDAIAELIAAVDEITTTAEAEAVAPGAETAPLDEVAARVDRAPVRDTFEEIEFDVPDPDSYEVPAIHHDTPAIAAAVEETAPPVDDFVQEMLRNIAASNPSMALDPHEEVAAAPQPSIAERAEEIAPIADAPIADAPIALNDVARVDAAQPIEAEPPHDARQEIQQLAADGSPAKPDRGTSLLGVFRRFRGGRAPAVKTAAPLVVEPTVKAPAAAPLRMEPSVRVKGPVTRQATVAKRSQWPRVAAVLLIGTGLVAGGRAYYLQEATPDTTHVVSAPTGKPNVKAGRLAVTSEPPGARVVVDGKFRGVTPLTIPDLPPGSHAVVLQSSEGSVRRTVAIKTGGEVALNESIYEGYLLVFAPFEVQVSEGKRLLGTTESGKMMLSSGRHELVLSNRTLGYREARVVDVNPGETVSLNVKAVEGIVRVTAAAGTDVVIDGQPVGTTPLGDLRVAVGSREIVLKNPQLGERRTVVDVTLTAPVDVKFQ